MPNHRSALKATRKAAIRTLRNRMWKSMVRTSVRKVREAAGTGSTEIQALLNQAFQVIDKAASKGVIHRNTASRKKARLSRLAVKKSA